MHSNYSQSPEKRVAFLERVEHYVSKRPRWTPAEGALLVNGVLPPPERCKEIPLTEDGLRQLDDPDLPATRDQLNGARYVLKDYRECVEGGDLPSGDDVLSHDFLQWCYDSDKAPWRVVKLPEFLRHIYFPGSFEHPFVMSVADELASLRIMAAAAKELNAQRASHTAPPTPTKIIRHRIAGKQRENELDRLIEKAIQTAETDNVGLVWQELRKMALSETHPFTGQVVDDTRPSSGASADKLFYNTNIERKDGRRVLSLSMKALGNRLSRRSKRLAK